MHSGTLTLLPSEKRVYTLLLKGFAPKRIAELLCIEHSTVVTHRQRIFQKKFVTTTQELLAQRIKELEIELESCRATN